MSIKIVHIPESISMRSLCGIVWLAAPMPVVSQVDGLHVRWCKHCKRKYNEEITDKRKRLR